MAIEQADESNIDTSDFFGEQNDAPINLFGEDEETVEESEGEISEEDEVDEEDGEEADDTEEDEEDEESDESDEEEDDAEEEEQPNPVADNLKKALHAERAKRKEAAEQLSQMGQHVETVVAQAEQYGQAYEAIVASLKENGLEDLVDVPKVQEVSPEVLEARRMKQEQANQENVTKFYDYVRTEATSLAPDYKNVDLSNNDHGTLLTQVITAAVVSGIDREAAIAEGMSVVDRVVANAKKEALKSRQPAVKPKSKPNARTKQSKGSNSIKSSIRSGNTDDVFSKLAKEWAKGS